MENTLVWRVWVGITPTAVAMCHIDLARWRMGKTQQPFLLHNVTRIKLFQIQIIFVRKIFCFSKQHFLASNSWLLVYFQSLLSLSLFIPFACFEPILFQMKIQINENGFVFSGFWHYFEKRRLPDLSFINNTAQTFSDNTYVRRLKIFYAVKF